jgi:hypothetical protein
VARHSTPSFIRVSHWLAPAVPVCPWLPPVAPTEVHPPIPVSFRMYLTLNSSPAFTRGGNIRPRVEQDVWLSESVVLSRSDETAATMPTAIRPTMRAYSTAVAPRSTDRRVRRNRARHRENALETSTSPATEFELEPFDSTGKAASACCCDRSGADGIPTIRHRLLGSGVIFCRFGAGCPTFSPFGSTHAQPYCYVQRPRCGGVCSAEAVS